MSDVMSAIRHLDFDLVCEAPGHSNNFNRPLPGTRFLRNTHECLTDLVPIIACQACALRMRQYVQIKCPKCGGLYSGRDIKEGDGPQNSKAPEWG